MNECLPHEYCRLALSFWEGGGRGLGASFVLNSIITLISLILPPFATTDHGQENQI